jgi:thioredoxin reductase (NADPH)
VCEKVYLVHRRNAFRASAASIKRAESKENIEFVYSSVIEEIVGDGMRVNGVKLKYVESGETSEISCAGVFVAVGRVPDAEIYGDTLERDGSGYIVAAGSVCISGVVVTASGLSMSLLQPVSSRQNIRISRIGFFMMILHSVVIFL